MLGRCEDGIAGIQRAAAAEADHDLAVLLFRKPDACFYCAKRGLARNRKSERSDSLLAQERHHWFGAAPIAASHNQRAAAKLPGERAELAQLPGAKNNPWRSREFKLHQETFVNFTLARGSAIIGATASRQTW